MEHGMFYGTCKKIVHAGNMSKEQMMKKFGVLMLGGGLTEADYEELVAEMGGGE